LQNEACKIAPNELADEGINPEEIKHFDEVITRLKSYSNARQTAGIDQKDIHPPHWRTADQSRLPEEKHARPSGYTVPTQSSGILLQVQSCGKCYL